MDKKEKKFLLESNKIEGEYSEGALEDSITAWDYAKNFIPAGRKIDTAMIKTIHKFLMKRLDSRIAGKIRKVDVFIGGGKGSNPEEIENELKDLCKFQPANPKKYDLPHSNENAVKDWHIQFEKIHPFEDGNGRTGRILMNIQRLKIKLPILIIKEDEKQEYYKWFRENNQNGKSKIQ